MRVFAHPSGRVHLLQLDLTADGLDELLFHNQPEHSTLGWIIYSPGPEGLHYLGQLTFQPWWIRIAPEDGALLVFCDESKVLTTYQIDLVGIRTARELDWSTDMRQRRPEMERMRAWRESVGLRIFYTMYTELQSHQDAAVWRDLAGGEVVSIDVDFSSPVFE